MAKKFRANNLLAASETSKLLAAVTVGLLGAVFVSWLFPPAAVRPETYICYVMLALVASALRATRMDVAGSTSMSFLFILVSLIELPVVQTLLIGGWAILMVSPIQAKAKNRALLTMTDLLTFCLGTLAAHFVYHHPAIEENHLEQAVRFSAAAAACFVATSIPATIVAGLAGPVTTQKLLNSAMLWTLPYYLLSGAVTGVYAVSVKSIGWQSTLAYLPFAFILWHTYRLYMGRLESHRLLTKDVEGLHLRTIETMALAIGARDQEMSRHLERVQVYAVEMGKALHLGSSEIEGLKAAALLHDIGKLGVPEHIISKPGRLTPEEFEKMKVHPMVGAEILSRVNFPYPVVPFVRHHHERWDGSGYPDGLKGEAIPIGARILTVVDCLDALASDRQYRRALPIDAAVDQVAAEAGRQFDPRLISLLKKHYKTWEALVASERSARDASSSQNLPMQAFDRVVKTIGSASAEVNSMFELTQELGNSLNLADTFAALGPGLKRLVPHSAMAVYLKRRERLYARHLAGEFPVTPESLELKIGEGLSGRVAVSCSPIVNGDPQSESDDPIAMGYFSTFQSAVSIALPGPDSVLGVLTLYHEKPDAFSNDQLRKLQALVPKLSQAVANGVKFKMAEDKAGTDHLTGLPNAHSLYLHLDHELGLSRCMSTPLAVVVCDLNGFKLVNDTLGHLVGNQLLQAVGAALRESCREYDFVARMGGDEFVMILSGVQQKTAQTKIKQLREVIRNASRQACREGMIFGSFGLAMYPRDAPSADELLACADRNMYRDKEEQKSKKAGSAFGTAMNPAWKPNPLPPTPRPIATEGSLVLAPQADPA
jgi:diguanylate cyclase (GGDEF)-like protein/putative nucleotidyltransferase with HDIG domain